MWRVRHVPLVIVALGLVWITAAQAQEERRVRGKVTALAADSITLSVEGKTMTFSVDKSTELVAPGAGRRARAAEAQGLSGVNLAEFVKVGDNVEIAYHDMGGGRLHAARIRRAVGREGMIPTMLTAAGEVTAVTADSITIKTDKGETSFAVSPETRVVGRGLGTMAREKQEAGAALKMTEAVRVGDAVSIRYREREGQKQAVAVRVTRRSGTE